MKRLGIIIILLYGCFVAFAQETYLAPSELPDLVKCLPAPPQKDSPAFKYDVERYKWWKQQRQDAYRMAMAKDDAVWTYDALLVQLSPSFGLTLSKETTPEIWRFLENSLQTIDPSRVAASIGYSTLQTSPEFRAQMEKAREEFRNAVLVPITDVIPDVILETRYYSTYNFVGTRIDGYLAPTALLTKEAAAALKAVSDDVIAQGYRLKIYDAYRPQKGVDHFVRWAADVTDTTMKPYFYPDLDKSVLFDQEYIMEKSGHTRGSTLDLTLFDITTEKEVDMGGTFDWFGPESHQDFCGNPETGAYTGDNGKSPTGRNITEEQFHNRMILRKAMLAHGFKPIDSEWWHFTLKDKPFPDTYFTFPV